MFCLLTHFWEKIAIGFKGGIWCLEGQLPQDNNKLRTTQKLLQMGLDFLGLILL